MDRQEGDKSPNPFSYLHGEEDLASGVGSRNGMEQVACYQTHTTPETHRMIRDNLHLSVHIQETKKGSASTVIGNSMNLTESCEVRDIVLHWKPRSRDFLRKTIIWCG